MDEQTRDRCKPLGAPARCTLFRLAAAGLLAVALLAGCQSAQQRQDRLERFIDEILFGGPFDAHHRQDGQVVRWRGHMRVWLTGPQAAAHRAPMAERLSEVAELSGLQTSLVGAGAARDLTVKLVEDSAFLVSEEFAACYVHLEGEDHFVDGATIYVGMDQPEGFGRCIDHEIMHALGFRFHSGRLRSVLSPVHGERRFTVWDRLAIRALFDSRMRPGMSREEALPLLREILSELVVQR